MPHRDISSQVGAGTGQELGCRVCLQRLSAFHSSVVGASPTRTFPDEYGIYLQFCRHTVSKSEAERQTRRGWPPLAAVLFVSMSRADGARLTYDLVSTQNKHMRKEQATQSTWRMPWREKPMKDAETGETFKGSCKQAMSLEIPNGATHPE